VKRVCIVEFVETRNKKVAIEIDFDKEELSATGLTPSEVESRLIDEAIEMAEDIRERICLDEYCEHDWDIEFIKSIDDKTLDELGVRYDDVVDCDYVRYRESLY
jgi:hypothetical protein